MMQTGLRIGRVVVMNVSLLYSSLFLFVYMSLVYLVYVRLRNLSQVHADF